MKNFHQILFCIFVLNLTLLACKLKKEESAEKVSAEEFANLKAATFNLTASAEGETREFQLQEAGDYAGHSPLSRLNYSYFGAAKAHRSFVLDILPNGKLIDVSTGRSLPSSCIAVTLYEKFSAAAVTVFAFISNLTGQWTSIESLGPEWLQFEYCEESQNLRFNFKIRDDAGRFREALNARGLTLLDPAPLRLSASVKELRNFFDTSRPDVPSPAFTRTAAPLGKQEGSAPLGKQEGSAPLKEGDVAGGGSKLRDAGGAGGLKVGSAGDAGSSPINFRSFFKAHEELSLFDRIGKNQFELETFKQMMTAKKVKELEKLGSGYHATVWKVEIDGKAYAIRKEIVGEGRPKTVIQAHNARARALIQNQFARDNPNAGIVKTHLSYVDKDSGEFVTISEFREGEDFWEAIFKRTDVALETRKGWTDDLGKQLRIYHEGYDMTIKVQDEEIKFNTSIIHGDVKPENVILGKDGRAAFIDFETSRIILKDPKGLIRELKVKVIDESGEPKLEIDQLVLDEVEGTAAYMSSGLLFASGRSLKDEAALNILRGGDNYAMGLTIYNANF